MNTIYFFAIILLCYLLSKATDLTVHSLRTFKNRIRINELVLAFFFLGIITSIPEMFVAINSAIQGVPNLSLGNLLGANIVVLSFMLGVTALFTGKISIHGLMMKSDLYLSLFVTGLPVIFVLDGKLDRWEGIMLIISFVVLVASFYKHRHFYQTKSKVKIESYSSRLKELGFFIFSICALLITSHILVETTIIAANAWEMPLFIVGLLLISIGTNAPELGFVLQQASKAHADNKAMAIGVLLGNTVVNTLILGILTAVKPFDISDVTAIWATSAFLITTLVALGYFMHSGSKLSRLEGVALMLIYILFVFYISTINSGQLGNFL